MLSKAMSVRLYYKLNYETIIFYIMNKTTSVKTFQFFAIKS